MLIHLDVYLYGALIKEIIKFNIFNLKFKIFVKLQS